jgi:hypothetical protein
MCFGWPTAREDDPERADRSGTCNSGAPSALASIREAIVACLEVRAEQGLPLTVRTVEVDVAVA